MGRNLFSPGKKYGKMKKKRKGVGLVKKWAIVGVLAALVVSVLLIGKYQDQKYPVSPDGGPSVSQP